MTHVIKPDFDEAATPQPSGYEGFDQVFKGAGSPEGRVAGAVGSLYQQSDATYGRGWWEKLTGTGTSGWINKASLSDGAVYDVKMFVAKGDGVTDDTAEIQAAIDAAAVAGGTVVLPPGSYGISAPLIFTQVHTGISILGVGRTYTDDDLALGTRLVALSGFPDSRGMIEFAQSPAGTSVERPANISFQDISIIGDATVDIGILFKSARHISFTRCTISGQLIPVQVIPTNTFVDFLDFDKCQLTSSGGDYCLDLQYTASGDLAITDVRFVMTRLNGGTTAVVGIDNVEGVLFGRCFFNTSEDIPVAIITSSNSARVSRLISFFNCASENTGTFLKVDNPAGVGGENLQVEVNGYRRLPTSATGYPVFEVIGGRRVVLTLNNIDDAFARVGADLLLHSTNASGQVFLGAWGDHPFRTWKAGTAYGLGDLVVPTSSNGHFYQCTVTGTSDSGEPVWPTDDADTVADNTVTWTESGSKVPHKMTITEADFG